MAATLKLHACPLPLPPATKSHPSSSLAYNNSLTIHDSRLQWRLCSSASLMSVRGRSLTWRRRCIGIGIGTNNEPFPSAKLIKLIRDFYEILNKKETKRLSELIDSHCIFEDLAFASPFKGKDRAIPFTKGCSFFYCARSNGNKLLIKKACVFIESPLKPGAVVLDKDRDPSSPQIWFCVVALHRRRPPSKQPVFFSMFSLTTL
ncbi:hypothetical protein AXF42_Ash008487 [Apostasia shenzhenica]|uniref:Uncharacterized protein n=1 Tax=Apostasia shenzhenica TaxID=1088818 RepID=A0A2I0AXZ9_9ASPA|nr:hypothetical protein AXF42_Ash008487 [Apostasia shenzhenica]